MQGMAVVGDELYVCDACVDNACIRVFSMSGEHLREITGDWRRPFSMIYVRDRLYLTEQIGENENEPENETAEEMKERLESGHRIVVLTPQGDTLQKYVLDGSVNSIGVLGDKLLVRLTKGTTIRALKGL